MLLIHIVDSNMLLSMHTDFRSNCHFSLLWKFKCALTLNIFCFTNVFILLIFSCFLFVLKNKLEIRILNTHTTQFIIFKISQIYLNKFQTIYKQFFSIYFNILYTHIIKSLIFDVNVNMKLTNKTASLCLSVAVNIKNLNC